MKEAAENYSFADAELLDWKWEDGNCSTRLKAWDEKIIKMTFIDCIQFSYKLGDGISGFYVNDSNSDFLDSALSRNYKVVPSEINYRHYMLVDIDDFPFFELVATNVILDRINV